MNKKTRQIANFTFTTGLLVFLMLVAYYVSNKQTIFSRFLPELKNNQISTNLIINNKYNEALEGSVLDNIYEVNARIISGEKQQKLFNRFLSATGTYLSDPGNSKYKENYSFISSEDTSKQVLKATFKDKYLNYGNYYRANVPVKRYSYLYFNNTASNQVNTSVKQSNRFEGLVEYTKNSAKKRPPADNYLISSLKNWNAKDSALPKTFYQPRKITPKYPTDSPFLDNYNPGSPINRNIVKFSEDNLKFRADTVKSFSSDPLKSVIEDVLTPKGLPHTPANVNAIAKGMGLPSGSLGSSESLASSLGLSVEQLANPNTRLPASIVSSINKNKNYLGKTLDINNTTLAEYYNKVLQRDSGN